EQSAASRPSWRQLPQVEVEWAKLAAIIASADRVYAAGGAGLAERGDAGAHCGGHVIGGEAIDDDLEHAFRPGFEPARHQSFQSRTIGMVGRSNEALVARSDFRTRTDDAARKRQDHIGKLAHRADRVLGRAQHLSAR